MTKAQVKGALTTAARYAMASTGNAAVSLSFNDSAIQNWSLDYKALSSGWGSGRHFTESAAKGGMLVERQVAYRLWASFPTPGSSTTPTITAAPWTITKPSGNVRYADFMVNNLALKIIGSGMVHGKLTVGLYNGIASQITLAMVTAGGHSRWYVAGMNNDTIENVPSAIYWTKP